MWEYAAKDYRDLIVNPEWDSQFLRERGLVPNIVDMIGDCDEAVLLDAGTGSVWLFDFIKPAKAYACDIVEPERTPPGVAFEVQNIEALTYQDDTFDIVVASLLLIFCENLKAACRELYRVAKPQGSRLIVSLTHPFFYRTGTVMDDESFLLTEDLSQPFQLELKIAEQVGPVTYYYRPLPDYVNQLIEAGWCIKGMRDWYIDMSEYKERLADGLQSKIKRTGHIPLYSFIECEKA